jgi:hypothetical protein
MALPTSLELIHRIQKLPPEYVYELLDELITSFSVNTNTDPEGERHGFPDEDFERGKESCARFLLNLTDYLLDGYEKEAFDDNEGEE